MAGGRAAVVVPGLFYSADGPLLMYAGLAVERRGGSVRRISWTVPQSGDGDEERAWVAAQVSEAVDAVAAATGVAAPVVIGKSLGSLAAPVAAGRGLPAVWLTPILTDEPTVAALRRAAAPCLLIGGTADKVWDGRLARSLTPHVLEIDGADHGLFVPGRLAQSAAVLGQVTTAVENFLDHQTWPQNSEQGTS
jgi:pimeloyl-ACP methyl ester carboxylesterase